VLAYIFRDVVHDIRLQGHVHIYGASNIAQVSLAHIQHSLNPLRFLVTNNQTIPCLSSYSFDGGPDLRQAQKVDIGILLLVLSSLL
jgi:hypothetical protein